MTTANRNLGLLVNQMQGWWTAKHAQCHQPPVVSEDYSWLYGGISEDIPVVCGWNCGWRANQSKEQLIADLRSHLSADAVEAAGLLANPDAQIAEQVASLLVPPPMGTELMVVTDLIQAAGAQTVKMRNRKLVGAGIGIAALMWYFLGEH